MHALGNIAGDSRPENKILLNGDAEESLRRLMYITASKSSKLTPSVSIFFLIFFSYLLFISFQSLVCVYIYIYYIIFIGTTLGDIDKLALVPKP